MQINIRHTNIGPGKNRRKNEPFVFIKNSHNP